MAIIASRLRVPLRRRLVGRPAGRSGFSDLLIAAIHGCYPWLLRTRASSESNEQPLVPAPITTTPLCDLTFSSDKGVITRRNNQRKLSLWPIQCHAPMFSQRQTSLPPDLSGHQACLPQQTPGRLTQTPFTDFSQVSTNSTAIKANEIPCLNYRPSKPTGCKHNSCRQGSGIGSNGVFGIVVRTVDTQLIHIRFNLAADAQ